MADLSVSNRIKSFFTSGYDVIASTGRRKAISSSITSEDEQLKGRDRRQLIATGHHLQRNFAVVAWAIRRHLDYVTQFSFQVRTEDDAFNERVEGLMNEWSRPLNCDVAGRHGLQKFLRLLEARKTLDGDVFALKRSSGQLQAIEADRIRQPDEIPDGETWINGVRVNRNGRAMGYALHDRENRTRYKFRRTVRASNVCHHGCFERFDQVRGISPLSAAFNSFQDVYEGISYALAKMKVEQLFAMVITSIGEGTGAHTKLTEDEYDVDIGKGPVKLEMEPGDDAKFLMSNNPGSNTQEFIKTVLAIALKALDIPMNFYDESHTNFFGSRAAWLLYDRSCLAKRAELLELLRQLTVWRIRLWILDGDLMLPRGQTIEDIRWEWVPLGMPWWDPSKEISGDILACAVGFDNPYRVCKERGRGEFEDNIRQTARAVAFAEEQGIELSYRVQPLLYREADIETTEEEIDRVKDDAGIEDDETTEDETNSEE